MIRTIIRLNSIIFILALFVTTTACYHNDSKRIVENINKSIIRGNTNDLLLYLTNHIQIINKNDSWDGSTFLHIAGFNNQNLYIIETLIRHGADPNIADLEGRTPLHNLYIYNADTNIIEYLIGNNADNTIKDSYGKIPSDYKQ